MSAGRAGGGRGRGRRRRTRTSADPAALQSHAPPGPASAPGPPRPARGCRRPGRPSGGLSGAWLGRQAPPPRPAPTPTPRPALGRRRYSPTAADAPGLSGHAAPMRPLGPGYGGSAARSQSARAGRLPATTYPPPPPVPPLPAQRQQEPWRKRNHLWLSPTPHLQTPATTTVTTASSRRPKSPPPPSPPHADCRVAGGTRERASLHMGAPVPSATPARPISVPTVWAAYSRELPPNSAT